MRIVVLTGAGISAESGLQTFRASDGLWCDHRVEDVATPEAFVRNPALVQQFYNMRRAQLAAVQPNAAHRALAELAASQPGQILIVTQNVDDLHQRAHRESGAPDTSLIAMHGELLQARCLKTGRTQVWSEDITLESRCLCCGEAGRLRPHIVWFGEMPLAMDRIYTELEQADLFAAIGTSGMVYPAAGFVQVARDAGADTVEINLEPSAVRGFFNKGFYGPASTKVPEWVKSLS